MTPVCQCTHVAQGIDLEFLFLCFPHVHDGRHILWSWDGEGLREGIVHREVQNGIQGVGP
jgi:hypothetical protein